jgi:urate oxidase
MASSAEYELTPTYGKQSVPVFKIRKEGNNHSIIDMVVKIMLEGTISKSWLEGENSEIVPTETQKNTCYALAMKTQFDCIEDYGLALGRDMLARHSHLSCVNLDITERTWERAQVGGRAHNHVFVSSPSPVRRLCRIKLARGDAAQVTSGVCDIKVMKTTQSGFMGYIQDEYTTLKPVGVGGSAPDRIMCTEMVAEWSYATGRAPEGRFVEVNKRVFDTLLSTLAGPTDRGVFSKSLQETAYKMAVQALDSVPELSKVSLATPNVHFYPYDLEQFGMPNPNVVFQSTDCHSTASGRIMTTVTRKQRSRL